MADRRLAPDPRFPDLNRDNSDFAAMFEQSFKNDIVKFNAGDQVSGTVISIGKEFIFLDLGQNNEAALKIKEVLDNQNTLTCKVGDTLTVFVISVTPELQVSKALQKGLAGEHLIEEAHANGIPVEAKVVKVNKGGFEVEVLGKSGFVPISQMDTRRIEDPTPYLGQTLQFKITEYGNRKLVLSRAVLLKAQNQEKALKRMETLKAGDICDGQIADIKEYGIFVDLGGIQGLVHVSEVSWDRSRDGLKDFSIGDVVKVKVLDIARNEDDLLRSKLSLSLRQTDTNPWENIDHSLIEQELSATITKVENFGAFAQIRPGVEGLIHVSEISWQRVTHPSKVVSVGDSVTVKVLDIDFEQKRISLSLKACEQDPWEDVITHFPVGKTVKGVVKKQESFGYFVTLNDHIQALLPKRFLKDSDVKIRIGEPLDVQVVELDLSLKRISVQLPQEGDEAIDTSAYLHEQQEAQKNEAQNQGNGLGSLGIMLQKKLSETK